MNRLRTWAAMLRREVLVLWLAARDPRVPLAAKAIAALVAAYALSPVDLIPDFIPVLGLLDDLLIVPAGVWLALRLVPAELRLDLRARATGLAKPGSSRLGLVLVALCWLMLAGAAGWLWSRRGE